MHMIDHAPTLVASNTDSDKKESFYQQFVVD